MATLAGLILFNALIEQLVPILSKYIVDEIVAQTTSQDGNLNRLYLLIGISFAASFIRIVVGSVSERLGDHFSGRLRQFLTEKFYDKVLTLPQSYFDSEISGKIVHQLNRGILNIKDFMNTATNFILPTIIQSIITIGILSYYNLQIGFFMTLLFPIYLSLSYYSTKKWGKEEKKKNKIEDEGRGRIQEVITNMKVVKTFRNQLNEFNFIHGRESKINKIYAKQSSTFHLFDFARNFSLQIILLIVDVVVFYNTFQGNLTIGEMVLIIQLVTRARSPLFAMSFILTRIQQAENGSKEYFEIMGLPSTENYRSHAGGLEKLKDAEVRFKDVSFRYDEGKDSKQVLKNIDIKLEPNKSVALVGRSGAGKTTLINLILKFYETTTGDILLNGQKYSGLSHDFVRNNVALVFQDNELFSTTIKENVSYGNPGATEKDIIKALKMANAYDFVMEFPKGLDTEVGERGLKLSGGQKQRIQIARAILDDAPILILDEATSSLDAKSEKDVQDALEALMQDRLVIIIAHRFSTIQNVDRIIVLEDGTITDSDTPQQLAKKPGLYSTLLKYQIEGDQKLLENFEIY